jgi:hypothetical protein
VAREAGVDLETGRISGEETGAAEEAVAAVREAGVKPAAGATTV